MLKRLEHEVAKPESPMIRPGDTCREEIEVTAGGYHRVLKILDQILEKYNALSETERSGRKLWQRINFGSGQMAELADFRSKVVYYTSAISLFCNMISIGTFGSIERQMNEAGGDLKETKQAVNGTIAHLIAKDRSEGSVLTAYPDDDKSIWRELRRELVKDGFSSSVIGKHKHLIKAYIGELGARELLDDAGPQAINGPSNSNTLVAKEKDLYRHISAEANADPLPAPEGLSDTKFSFTVDSSSDVESKFELTEEGVVDVQGVKSLSDSQKDTVLTTHTERPRQLHCSERITVDRPNTKCSIASSYTGTQNFYAENSTKHSGDDLSPNLESPFVKAEADVEATNSTNKDDVPLQETAYPDSPAEIIRVVSDAWYNEFLLTSQYPNIVPSVSAKITLRNLLSMLGAVNLEAVGWSNEHKAWRITLIRQIHLRLKFLERKSQELRKYHTCRPRCFCKSDASDNIKSIKETGNFLKVPPYLSSNIHDGALLKSPSFRLSIERRLELSRALHRAWHDHHDRTPPLCLEWAEIWGRKIWDQGRFLKILPMNAECFKLLISMRENKQNFETLDLDGDVELTALRQQLKEDTKSMVSSLRIFKSDKRWRRENSDIHVKATGWRVCIDISWVKETIVSSLGTKCGFCSGS